MIVERSNFYVVAGGPGSGKTALIESASGARAALRGRVHSEDHPPASEDWWSRPTLERPNYFPRTNCGQMKRSKAFPSACGRCSSTGEFLSCLEMSVRTVRRGTHTRSAGCRALPLRPQGVHGAAMQADLLHRRGTQWRFRPRNQGVSRDCRCLPQIWLLPDRTTARISGRSRRFVMEQISALAGPESN